MSFGGDGGSKINLHQLLKAMIDKGASDLHVTTGSPPQLRIDGLLVPLRTPPLSPVETKQLCYSVLTDAQKLRFEEDQELDFSFGVKGLARFRGNVFVQRGVTTLVVRMIPFEVAPFETLGLPASVAKMADLPRGFVLITGPTGSGKTTTLYSALNELNTIEDKLITTEDPVEYDIDGIIQVPIDSEIGHTFAACLRAILRQDPDRILVGEIRDVETAEIAVQASRTGHMVFSTLHTNDAPSTVTRLRDMGVPPVVITANVEALMAQRLVRRIWGNCKE